MNALFRTAAERKLEDKYGSVWVPHPSSRGAQRSWGSMTLHPSWCLMVPSDQNQGGMLGHPGMCACKGQGTNSTLESTGCAHPFNVYLLCFYCMQVTGLDPGETSSQEELFPVLVVPVEKATEAGREQAPEKCQEPPA